MVFTIKMIEKNSGRTTPDFTFEVGFITSTMRETLLRHIVSAQNDLLGTDLGSIGRQLTLGVQYETYVGSEKLGFIIHRSADFDNDLGCLVFKNVDTGCFFSVPFPLTNTNGKIFLDLPYLGTDLNYNDYSITDMNSLKALLGQFRMRYQTKVTDLYRMGMSDYNTAFFVPIWYDTYNEFRLITDIDGKNYQVQKGYFHNLFTFWNWYIFLTGQRYHPVQYLETMSGEKIYCALPISPIEEDHMLQDDTDPYFADADQIGKPCIAYDFQAGTDMRRLLPTVGSTLLLSNGSQMQFKHTVNNLTHYYYIEIMNATENPTVKLSTTFNCRRHSGDMLGSMFSGSLDSDPNFDYIQYFVGNNEYPCRLTAINLWATPYEDSGVAQYIAENEGEPASFWNKYPTTPLTIAATYTAIWDVDSDYTGGERMTIWNKDSLYQSLLLCNVSGFRNNEHENPDDFVNLFTTYRLTDPPIAAINTTNGGIIDIGTADGARRLWGISGSISPDEPESGSGSIGGGGGTTGESAGGRGTFNDAGDVISLPEYNIDTLPNQGLWNNLKFGQTTQDSCPTNLNALASYLSDWSLESYDKKFANILSLKVISAPMTPSGDVWGTLKIRNNTLEGSSVAKATRQYETFNLIENFRLEEYFGSFLDYAPYTVIQIYLPFSGTYDLNPSDIYGKTLKISVRIDWITGNLLYVIYADSTILYRFTGNSTFEYPLTSNDYTGRINAIIATLMSAGATVGSVATASVSGGLSLIGAVGNGVATVKNATDIFKEQGQTISKGAFGCNIGNMDVRRPYLLITRPKQIVAARYGATYGFPSMMSSTLSMLSGYIKVASCHWKNLDRATNEEIAEIDRLLKTEGAIL